MQACSQFLGIEGLRQIVVGARLKSAHKIVLLAARREQQQVHIRACGVLTNSLADLHTLQPGHHPVQNGESWSLPALQQAHCFQTVVCDHGLVSPFLEQGFEHASRNRIIFGNEDSLFVFIFVHHRTLSGWLDWIAFKCSAADSPNLAVNIKMLPFPGSLSTEICPPINLMRLVDMARPRPVPPNLRVVELSPCVKASKIRACFSKGIPIPVSRTRNTTSRLWPSR